MVTGHDPDLLAGSQWIVGSVALLDGLLEQSSSVGIDYNGGPGFEVIDCLADLVRIIVEECWVHGYVAQMRFGCSKHSLSSLGDHGPNERCDTGIGWLCAVKVDDKDIEGGGVLLEVEKDGPVETQD